MLAKCKQEVKASKRPGAAALGQGKNGEEPELDDETQAPQRKDKRRHKLITLNDFQIEPGTAEEKR